MNMEWNGMKVENSDVMTPLLLNYSNKNSISYLVHNDSCYSRFADYKCTVRIEFDVLLLISCLVVWKVSRLLLR